MYYSVDDCWWSTSSPAPDCQKTLIIRQSLAKSRQLLFIGKTVGLDSCVQCNRTIIKPQKRETNVDKIESLLEVLWGKLYTFSFYSPAIWMKSKCFIIWKVCVISIEVWRRWGIPGISSFDSLLACCVVGVWTFDSSLALLKTNCTFGVSSYVQWNVCLKYM